MKSKPYILHVDGDNFFVACEVVRFPHLKGKAVVVGEERGIASAMSVEAKKLGITRATPIFEIRKKFPEVVVLPSHFELYEQYNQKLYDVLTKYSDKVQRYSIDECFAYIYEDESCHQKLLKEIQTETELCLGITLSFGLASTKTLAKIASKKEKPSGCVIINEDNRIDILKDTTIGKVWGIGSATSHTLSNYKIYTAYDFITKDRNFIEANFGKNTLDIWFELRGELRYEIESLQHDQKSFQSTRSFGMSTKERSFLLSELSTHIEILCSRLRQSNLTTNELSFFIKKKTLYDRYLSSKINIGFYTNNPSDIFHLIEKKFNSIYEDEENSDFKYKATGISIYNLRPKENVQQDLFSIQSNSTDRNKYLEAIDSLHKSLGDDSIYLCSSHQARKIRKLQFDSRNMRNKFIYGLPLPYMGEVS
jgi:nucleotidyltransferase/DNA polymerase involved in DNA repair